MCNSICLRLKRILSFFLNPYKVKYWEKRSPNLYLGSIEKMQTQRIDGSFIGLSIDPKHFFEIYCDLSNCSLPFSDLSIAKVQAEDVLEHIEYKFVPKLFGEIYRVLRIGGVFRLSVPDYQTPFLRKRCVFNQKGEILIDALTGSNIGFDTETGGPTAIHDSFGNSHLWFPTHSQLTRLIEDSGLKSSVQVVLHHGYLSEDNYVITEIPDDAMPVRRSPPGDMRNNGKPISLIMDIIKIS
jgi:hypothetical protein